MGITFSCPGADYDSLDEGFETLYVRSFSFNGDDVRTTIGSVSFNGRDSDSKILKSIGSGKMIIEGSVSFKGREMETMISIKTPPQEMERNVTPKSVRFDSNREIEDPFSQSNSFNENIVQSPMLHMGAPKHEAALKLQKVYKSFRTRRQLADCAVLVEQRWWKLLDFAELKRNSVSFFNIGKPETAVSRWSRARKRAAKVGKGLSKDGKAQKLALQHWLEAIDPRHRYGHNLHFYYDRWLHCDSRQPFFYWLDIGKGKEVNLVDKCPRSKLQQQCIKYLGPTERKAYEVVVENGNFFYKQSGKLLDTTEGPKDAKWIFVLSTSKTLHVGQKKKGTFQHSSFLAGGATSAAGRLVVEKGILKAVWPHSGHYRPTEENFQEFVSFLMEHDVDLTNVQKSPTDEEEEFLSKRGSNIGLRSQLFEQDFINMTDLEAGISISKDSIHNRTDSTNQSTTTDAEPPQVPKSRRYIRFSERLTNLEIPKRTGLFENFESEYPSINRWDCESFSDEEESPLQGYETAEESLEGEEDEDCMVRKKNLFEGDGEDDEEIVPPESILLRINSKKGLNSYQLGKQLSRTWTTGAGPRISCVRDYPSILQFRALEEVHLSPRYSIGQSPKISTPTNMCRETTVTTTRTNCR